MKTKSVTIDIPQGYEVDQEKSTFTNIVFKEIPKDITEKIKTVEDACKELGESDTEVITLRQLESIKGLSQRVVDNQRLIVVIKALNEGWYPDWSKNDYKYSPVFCMRDSQVFHYVIDWLASTDVPASSLLKSRELVRYITSQFLDLYKTVFA